MRIFTIAFFLVLLCLGHVPAQGGGNAPFVSGEEIRYNITKFGLKAGEATLQFKGPAALDGREVLLIVFTAKAMNFYDEEKIYVDPAGYFPVQVDRDLNIFGNKEKISEVYDTASGRIIVTKNAGGKETQTVLEKKGQVENIYGFLYRYRLEGKFVEGDKIDLTLPTKDIAFQMGINQRISAGKKVYDAFYMESQPQQYRLWFDSSPQRIPLRIDGAVGFGNTSMVLAQYTVSKMTKAGE